MKRILVVAFLFASSVILSNAQSVCHCYSKNVYVYNVQSQKFNIVNEIEEESILTIDALQSTVIQQVGSMESIYHVVKKELNPSTNGWKYEMASTDGTIMVLEISFDAKKFSISPTYQYEGAQRLEYKFN